MPGWGWEGQTSQANERALAKARVWGPRHVCTLATSRLWRTSYFSLLFVLQASCIPNLIGHACLYGPLWCTQPCQASKDGVTGNLVLSCIIEFTNSTFRNLTKQGICKTVSNRAEPTTFPMTISLFTPRRYTLTAVDMLICMPIPRMLF